MKELLVGLLVIVLMVVLSGIGVILFPLFLLLSFIFRLIVGFMVVIFVVWLIGKATLAIIDAMTKK